MESGRRVSNVQSERTNRVGESDGQPRVEPRLRRRPLLAVLGLAATAGCLDGDSAESNDSDESADADEDESLSLPIEARAVDASGSTAGSVVIPGEAQVTLLNFTRLECPTSEGLIETIGDAIDELDSQYDVGPEGSIRFVSVVNPRSGPDPTDEELSAWWDDQGGRWTVGIDEEGALNDYYEVRGFPTVVALDADGEVHWRNRGSTSSGNIVRGVGRALEANAADEASTTNETDDDG
jgi:hypothetical protein